MIKTILTIDGMRCSMCEAHMNETIRRAFDVKKVKSSHKKNFSEIISEKELDIDELKKVIGATGYKVMDAKIEPYKKKGLFSR